MFKKYLFLTKETNSMKCKNIFFGGGGGGGGEGEGVGKGEMKISSVYLLLKLQSVKFKKRTYLCI